VNFNHFYKKKFKNLESRKKEESQVGKGNVESRVEDRENS